MVGRVAVQPCGAYYAYLGNNGSDGRHWRDEAACCLATSVMTDDALWAGATSNCEGGDETEADEEEAVEAGVAAVAEAEAEAAAAAEAEAGVAVALSEEPLCRADLAREMVALFDQTAEVLLGRPTLAEDGEAGGEARGEGGEVVAVVVVQKGEQEAEQQQQQQQQEQQQQQIARLMCEVEEAQDAQEAQEAEAAEEGDGGAGGAGSAGTPADALPRVARARRALALERSVLPSWESGESLLPLLLQAQPTNFPTHLVGRTFTCKTYLLAHRCRRSSE